METQLENSCVLKECLSGRSVLSFDEESDTNSVVYNKNEVGESPRGMGESPRGKEKEEALPMSQDFVEDDNTRFGEKKEKKSVSMGERLKNVWTRLGDGEEKKKKENEEKKKKNEEKKKEGEEKKKKEGQMAKKGKWEIDQRKGMQCQ